VPDDYEYSYLTMRSSAFRDADQMIVVGTCMNYIIGHSRLGRARQCQDRRPRRHGGVLPIHHL